MSTDLSDSTKTQAALERLRAVFAEHTFEFDGEASSSDADGEEGSPSSAREGTDLLYHTNNTLKYLLTCCKTLVDASLLSKSPHPQQQQQQRSVVTSPDDDRIAALEDKVAGIEILQQSIFKRVEALAMEQQNVSLAEGAGKKVSLSASLSSTSPTLVGAAGSPAGKGHHNALQRLEEHLGDVEQSMAQQFRLMEKEVLGLKSEKASVIAQLDELDVLHRERLNAALKSTYEQMDEALEDFVTHETLEEKLKAVVLDNEANQSKGVSEIVLPRQGALEERLRSLEEKHRAVAEGLRTVEADVSVINAANEARDRSNPAESPAFKRQVEAMVGEAIASKLAETESLSDDFSTLREAMQTLAARVEMNISDMRADLADCSTQSASWNGIIAAHESIKGRMAVIEGQQAILAKAPLSNLKAFATATAKEVIAPIAEAVDTLYSILDLPNKDECGAVVHDVAVASSKGNAQAVTLAVRAANSNANTTTAAIGDQYEPSSHQAEDGQAVSFFANHSASSATVNGATNNNNTFQQTLRKRQEVLIRTVHKGLPFKSLVSAIRRLGDAVAAVTEEQDGLKQLLARQGGCYAPPLMTHATTTAVKSSTTTPSKMLTAAASNHAKRATSEEASQPEPGASVHKANNANVSGVSDVTGCGGGGGVVGGGGAAASLADLAAVRARLKASQAALLQHSTAAGGESPPPASSSKKGNAPPPVVAAHSAAGSRTTTPSRQIPEQEQPRRSSVSFDFSQRPIEQQSNTSSSAKHRSAVGGFF